MSAARGIDPRVLSGFPEDIEDLAEDVAISCVTANVIRSGDTDEIFAELYNARHALDYIALRIDLPHWLAPDFRALLKRVSWLTTEVENAK